MGVDEMDEGELELLFDKMCNGDNSAWTEHLAAGNPVYFATSTTPSGYVEKLYPDGRRALARFDFDGEHEIWPEGDSAQLAVLAFPVNEE